MTYPSAEVVAFYKYMKQLTWDSMLRSND
jgi:hypothetical protein